MLHWGRYLPRVTVITLGVNERAAVEMRGSPIQDDTVQEVETKRAGQVQLRGPLDALGLLGPGEGGLAGTWCPSRSTESPPPA